MDFDSQSRSELIASAEKLVKQASTLTEPQRKLFEIIMYLIKHPTGVLGDREIRDAIASGQIVIDPFDAALLKPNSYDVTLGENFYVCEAQLHQNDFSPFSETEIRKYFRGPLKPEPSAVWCDKKGRKEWPGIEPDENIIVLAPGECILAHTNEYIGTNWGVTTKMQARSSIGRVNVSACGDDGLGDVGFISRWTMEMRNMNQKVSIPLIVGEPVAQVVFFHVADATTHYADSGNYQSSRKIEEVKADWTPERMLPKLYNRRQLVAIDVWPVDAKS